MTEANRFSGEELTGYFYFLSHVEFRNNNPHIVSAIDSKFSGTPTFLGVFMGLNFILSTGKYEKFKKYKLVKPID